MDRHKPFADRLRGRMLSGQAVFSQSEGAKSLGWEQGFPQKEVAKTISVANLAFDNAHVIEQHNVAKFVRQEKAGRILLRSAEMHWRGKLRETSIRNLPNRFVLGKGTPHVPLKIPIQYFSHPRVTSSH